MQKGFPAAFPFTLRITEHQRKTGCPRCTRKCPTALAFKLVLGAAYQPRSLVTHTAVYSSHASEAEIIRGLVKHLWIIKHPLPLQEWIRKYDRKEQPNTIETIITEDMVK